MARQARNVSTTGYYHAIVRGNNKNHIFKAVPDKELFFENLMAQQDEGLISIAAWCIMDNHAHMILKAEPEDLAIAFKKINVRFAVRYHLRHKTTGHIFQDRFKSQAIETDEYLIHAVRYVHNNPVKAGMVENPESFNWSSYQKYLNGSLDLNSIMRFVYDLMGNSDTQFIDFHKQEDEEQYLDNDEDIERERERKFNRILEGVFKDNGITSQHELLKRKDVFDGLINDLVNESGYSMRKIAMMLQVPYNRVQSGYNGKVQTIKMDRPR